MVQLKHYNGISQRLRPNKDGASPALKKMMGRPGNYNSQRYHSNANRNFIPRYKCDKCNGTATYSSTIDGEVEYRLCEKCFQKRYEETKNRKL